MGVVGGVPCMSVVGGVSSMGVVVDRSSDMDLNF